MNHLAYKIVRNVPKIGEGFAESLSSPVSSSQSLTEGDAEIGAQWSQNELYGNNSQCASTAQSAAQIPNSNTHSPARRPVRGQIVDVEAGIGDEEDNGSIVQSVPNDDVRSSGSRGHHIVRKCAKGDTAADCRLK